MILETLKEKLEEIDSNVYYGMVDSSIRELQWNYIVFSRNTMKINTNKTSYSDYYTVAIIRENFVPEGLALDVIDKVLEIDGMRLSGTDCSYSYIQKPNTNTVVEMLTISFVLAKKV